MFNAHFFMPSLFQNFIFQGLHKLNIALPELQILLNGATLSVYYYAVCHDSDDA